MPDRRLPAPMPSSGMPEALSWMKPHTTHCHTLGCGFTRRIYKINSDEQNDRK